MSIFKEKKSGSVIDLTKLRGKIKIDVIEHKGKAGAEYYCAKATFQDGKTVLIDMQLLELLNLKLHQTIRKKMDKEDSPMDLLEEIMELVSGDVVRDRILKSIYD